MYSRALYIVHTYQIVCRGGLRASLYSMSTQIVLSVVFSIAALVFNMFNVVKFF